MNSEKLTAEEREVNAGALAAMRRARKRAEQIAASTGTDLIEAVDGKPVRVATAVQRRS